MKIQEFYNSNSSRSILATDKAMKLLEKYDLQKLEVSQLKRKVREDAKIDLDLISDKKPEVKYNKNLYDEFRRKSSTLRLLEDKLTQLNLEISKLSPDIGSPSEAEFTKVEIMVLEAGLQQKLAKFKNRLLKRRKYNITACLELGGGSLDQGLINESPLLQQQVKEIEDLKQKYNTYMKHEQEILKIIDEICGD